MLRLLSLLCWMAVTMTVTTLPHPVGAVTTCATTLCPRGTVCRIVIQHGKIGPRCLKPGEIPPGGGPGACGSSGLPLLQAVRKGKRTVFTVFRCKHTCPDPSLLCRNGVCCAGVDTCDLPKDPGPCKAYIPRFYYDSKEKKCLGFIYGGCKGNDNNFKTLRDCQKKCPRGPVILPIPTCAFIKCQKGFKCIVGKGGPRCVPITVPGGVCPPVGYPLAGSKGSCGRECKKNTRCGKGERCCPTRCGYRACRRTIRFCPSLRCPPGKVCRNTPAGGKCVPVG